MLVNAMFAALGQKRACAGSAPALRGEIAAVWTALGMVVALVACAPDPLPTVPQQPAPLFADATQQAGLHWQHRSGGPEKWHILEAKGGGAAFLDYDGDGYLDIYLVNGSTLERTGHVSPLDNALYRNTGGGRFADVTAAAAANDTSWGMGCVAADYDNDGNADLYITNYGANRLYRNGGDGRFADATVSAGVGDDRWSTGAAFGDYDLDGDLDLYVANYVDFDPDIRREDRPFCQWKSVDVFCGPRSLRGATDRLYRNEGDGRFVDKTADAGVEDRHKYYGFAALFSDYDQDGWPDLFVANDSTPNLLYHNRGDGRFEDVALAEGVAYNYAGKGQAGMGAAWGDYDGDGFLDLFITHFASDYNTLYRNERGRFFVDVTLKAGLGDKSLPYVGWGTCFIDYDHDRDLDLFVANGHVYPQVDRLQLSEETYAQPNQLFENRGDGTFGAVEGVKALQERRVSRGACRGDYDNDGDLDLLILNLDDLPTLMRNDSATGHWFAVRLVGQRSNRDGVGARIAVFSAGKKQVREAVAGSGFLGGHDPRLHFGLAGVSKVDSLEVRWPSGVIDRLYELSADQLVVLVEGKGRGGL